MMLSIELLRAIFSYDPVTGKLVYIRDYRKSKIGYDAGFWKSQTRFVAVIEGREVCCGKIAYAIHTGKIPTGPVYRNDGNGKNLKWKNLTTSQRISRQPDTHRNLPVAIINYPPLERNTNIVRLKDGTVRILGLPEALVDDGSPKRFIEHKRWEPPQTYKYGVTLPKLRCLEKAK